jgi:ParB/RepB/Spo0J family partition protein
MTELRTEQLQPNDYNPNRMTDEEFAEFVEEVRHLGRLPKPVVVRNGYAGDAYQIVDGEHGWRAAKEVGLEEITCEVIEADDFEAMRQTYKRNQHGTHDRAALGEMFRRMMAERGISNRKLAEEIAVSEGTVRNALTFAEATELRNGYAPSKGKRDYWFEKMTTKQARTYVQLPDLIRDRWIDAAGDENALAPGDQRVDDVFHSSEDVIYYYQELVDTGVAKVFERGSFKDSVEKAWELFEWRREHRRMFGDEIDAYIRPVVEKHPVNPTPIELLEKIPMHDRKPLLTPEEWAKAIEVAWEKGERVYEVLGRFKDIAKLKAHDLGIPADDLEDPRTALKKMEIEQEAPAFLRDAPLPVHTKHWLLKEADRYYNARAHIDSSRLSPEERLQAKKAAVNALVKEHERYQAEQAAYEAEQERIRSLPEEEQLAAPMAGISGRGPKYPSYIPPVYKVWVACIKGLFKQQENAEQVAQQEQLKKTFEDPEEVIEAVVERFKAAAPKVFDKEVAGKPAWEVLRERLKATPKPEVLLLGAVMLKAPVGVWLDAVRSEAQGDAPED